MNAFERAQSAEIGSTAEGCCDAALLAETVSARSQPIARDPADVEVVDPTAFIAKQTDGTQGLALLVENLQCAACIGKIEHALRDTPGVVSARVNFSTHRLNLTWQPGTADPVDLMRTVTALGYPVTPFDAQAAAGAEDKNDKRLLSALAVAGFASANVMLLSVAVWSGHAGDMGDGTRTLFHWISALIALPAVIFAGQPFFRSAIAAIRGGGLNMDVPISLAVILASGMSVVQTMQEAEHAYFDASVTLLFFLLIGRYLDHRSRARARSAALHLLALQAQAATVIGDDGAHHAVRIQDVRPGMKLVVAVGERVPVDGTIDKGTSEIDTALITGESLPKLAQPGTQVFGGTLNLGAPLQMTATAGAGNSLLAEIVRLMEAAEQGRAKFVRIADRVARFYAPTVHILSLATFVGWFAFTNAGWQPSLMNAIAVLIITCPCALGLAVPAVQVVASGRLLKSGVLLKSADALEKLAEVDTVVFDKTGTLTLGTPALTGGDFTPDDLTLAAALAQNSKHPVSRALVRAYSECCALQLPDISDVQEIPGAGIEGNVNGRRVRLGRRDWCGATGDENESGSTVWLTLGDQIPSSFFLEDAPRDDACKTIAQLKAMGMEIALLSGDNEAAVKAVAEELRISDWRAGCLPTDKTAALDALAQNGKRVLMVGDGLNDAPSLVAAHVSMSPANAADVTQTAADLVFQGQALAPVAVALRVARQADRLVKQNVCLAFLYNLVAVPTAALGFATPLVAAIAMSSSSLVVTLNALRLKVLK